MKEREIRPKKVHNTILDLSKKDMAKFLIPRAQEFKKVACPACGNKKNTFEFKKFGGTYVQCTACHTLYLSPRPSEQLMNKVYNSLTSVQYWETGFYKETAEARREKMFKPRADKVVAVAKKYMPIANKDLTIVDVGCGYGIFLEEVRKTDYFKNVIGIEPTKPLAEVTKQKGFEVVEKWIDSKNVGTVPVKADVLTCFEVLEHVHKPKEFLQIFAQLVKPGGLFILSFPSVSGLDVQLLWENSNTVYPPHHINILSVEGAVKLVDSIKNLEIVDLSTPGKLDVDIVRNAIKDKAVKKIPRIFEYIFSRNDEFLFEKLQTFCQENLLSSHMFLVLRKKV